MKSRYSRSHRKLLWSQLRRWQKDLVSERMNLELYGKYKAKFSDELLRAVKRRTGWKTGTCYRDQSDSGRRGKDDNQCRLRTGIWKTWKKSSHCVKRAIFRTVLWYQRRCGRRRICPGSTNGRSEFTFYRRFPCDHFRK